MQILIWAVLILWKRFLLFALFWGVFGFWKKAMPAIVNYRGDDNFRSGRTSCIGDSGLMFSINSHTEIYSPPRKRARITGPFIVTRTTFESKRPSIDILPNECLSEIFQHMPGGRERSVSACVSKRWLTVLTSLRSSEFNQTHQQQKITNTEAECCCDGYLTRCVEGKKATDVRLAAIAVGTFSRGGLGKISIRGSSSLSSVSDLGLSAIARGCPSLKSLSLWNLPSIGDESLLEISRECRSLEKLDLCQCPSISNKGLSAIAQGCPNLLSLTIESCSKIGSESLQAISKFCPKLRSIAIKDCPLIDDHGIACIMSSPASASLTKVKLQSLNITDCSIAVIGHYGKSITDLVLSGLRNVTQKGFWVMGRARGLQMLSSLTVTLCRGITDLSLEMIGGGCPNLKHISLRKCCFVSDNGLVAFAKGVNSLESLQLEECNRITQIGVLTALSKFVSKVKTVSLVKCMGIKDLSVELPFLSLSPCESLRSLSIRGCPGFGSRSLAMVGKLCPNLHHLDLSGLCGITDSGLLPLLESCGASLSKVNLSECVRLTDEVVFALTRLHGETLRMLNLDGCLKITDESLSALAESCPLLNDLDVSRCWITDEGVAALSRGVQSNLQIVSFSGCSMLSNKSVSAIEKLGESLIGLNLQHCTCISSRGLEMLTENLWRCDILS